ncbi:unnamed protein product, partial [Meganyctiphanes norvegica]
EPFPWFSMSIMSLCKVVGTALYIVFTPLCIVFINLCILLLKIMTLIRMVYIVLCIPVSFLFINLCKVFGTALYIVFTALYIVFLYLYIILIKIMTLSRIFFIVWYIPVSFLFIKFAKIVKYLYRLLGNHHTEHDLANAILQLSDGCPRAYLTFVILLYSTVYIGCAECDKHNTCIFKCLEEVLDAEPTYGPPTFEKIHDILKLFTTPNLSPITCELLSLQVQDDRPKMFYKTLTCYFKVWLMALSLYCPHDLHKSTSISRKAQHSKSNVSATSKTVTPKSIKEFEQSIINNFKNGGRSLSSQDKSKHIENTISYPTTLLYALLIDPELRLGNTHCPLMDLITLNIHIVISSPVFELEKWKYYMHNFPNINRLHVVFVIHGKGIDKTFETSFCKVKDRVIKFSVQYMHYHMYFSSPDYKDPDIVVINNSSNEMPSSDPEGDIHSEISYRNMTHSQDTLLVVIDTSKELVRKKVRAVNTARPVKQLMIDKSNTIMGLSFKKGIERNFFTCIRRK